MTLLIDSGTDPLNTFSIQFIDSSEGGGKLRTSFIGLSDTYKNSHVFGFFKADRISINDDESQTYSYFIEMNINSIHVDITGVITKSPNVQLSLQKSWDLIFKQGKKSVIGINTINDKNRDENNEYKVNLASSVDSLNNVKLYIFIENYNWPQKLILENTNKPVTQPPATQPPATQPPATQNENLNYECIISPNQLNIVNYEGSNKIVLNFSNSYDANKRYVLNTGYYKITNIPESHPIAILHDNTGNLGYVGDNSKVLFKDYNNLSYPYYWGEIDIIVASNFNPVTIDTYYEGSLNGENLLYYSDQCPSFEYIDSSNNDLPTETEDEVKTGYFPPEIVGKSYYFDLFDFINKRNYISTFAYYQDKLIETFYTDNTLQEVSKVDEHPIEKFIYNTKTRNLILDQKYDTAKYIIPSNSQGIYSRLITSLTFNEDFTVMNEFDKFMNMKLPELKAFEPFLISNGWIVNLDESYAQTGLKTHTLNIPGLNSNGVFPPLIVDKIYYAWVYDNVNEEFYLSTYIFEIDKLTEVFYTDITLTDYVRVSVYPVEGVTFDSSKNTLVLRVKYNEDQYIINSNKQGRYRQKQKTIIFNQDFTTFTESDKFLEMFLPEINAFKPLMEALNWNFSEDELWVEFSWLSEGNSFGLTIPEKPSNENEVEFSTKFQCLNKGLVNNFGIGKNDNDENVIIFNGVPYSLNENISVGNGSYTIVEVPKEHPIGFAINNLSKFEIIGGDEFGVKILEGLFVMHYYGTIRFEVKGDFGTISYHCYNHGYMGGEKRLKYDNNC